MAYEKVLKVRMYFLLRDAQKFPWSILGLDIPRVGSTHSHICRILAPFAPKKHQAFFSGGPAFFELLRISRQEDAELAQSIYNYCERVYQKSRSDRAVIEQEVLFYIKDSTQFTDWAATKLNSLLRQKLISLPAEYVEEVE